jgi:hypothetical protein
MEKSGTKILNEAKVADIIEKWLDAHNFFEGFPFEEDLRQIRALASAICSEVALGSTKVLTPKSSKHLRRRGYKPAIRAAHTSN